MRKQNENIKTQGKVPGWDRNVRKRVLSALLALYMFTNSFAYAGADVSDYLDLSESDGEVAVAVSDSLETAGSYRCPFGDGGEMLLSRALELAGCPFGLNRIQAVNVPGDDAFQLIQVMPRDGDYVISALRSFSEASLDLMTEDAVYTLWLTDGVPVEEQTQELEGGSEEAGESSEEAEQPVEYPCRMSSSGRALLSAVLNAVGINLSFDGIDFVGMASAADDGTELMSLEKTDDDYLLTVQRDFEAAWLKNRYRCGG